MRRLFGRSILYSVSIVLGLVAGLILCQSQSVMFIPQITLGQALQTGALLLIFITAHRYFEKAHDRRRKTIEILVDMVGGTLNRVDHSHEVFLKCAGGGPISDFARLRLDGALRDYSNAVKGIEDVLEQSGHLKEATGLARVKDDRSEYKDLVTESPYPQQVPKDRIPEESNLYARIKAHLVSLQLELSGIG